jgi:hypothetical protein
LTTATSFAQRGVEVLLVERRPAFDVPGVGLGQPANALRIYNALGLLPDILASGFPYDRMYIFDPKRELIVQHKFLLGDDRVPAFCALSRLRLHEILLAPDRGVRSRSASFDASPWIPVMLLPRSATAQALRLGADDRRKQARTARVYAASAQFFMRRHRLPEPDNSIRRAGAGRPVHKSQRAFGMPASPERTYRTSFRV